MSTDRETTHAVRSWLDEGVSKLPDRVLDAVLDQVPATQQRRPFWPPRRFPRMNSAVRYAIAAAAVLAVALVGLSSIGGQPSPSPTSVPTAPVVTAAPVTAAPVASAAPTRQPAFPSAGPMAIGRHHFTLEGVSLSLEVTEPGWTSGGEVFVEKGAVQDPAGISLLLWPNDPAFVFADSCGNRAAPPVGPAAADMAAAIAGMSQLELVSGPTSVTLDGKPAQHVVVRVPAQIACPPDKYWLWGFGSLSRYATAAGSTYSVWIIDAGKTRIQIDGESFAGAGPDIAEEIRTIVESIRFD